MEKAARMLKRFLPRSIFVRGQNAYHFVLAFAAALRYGFPGRGMRVIGVTGTKGKTTTVALLHEVLAASGAKVASVSSVCLRIGDRQTPNDLKMTMPGRFFIQRFLRDARRAGCAYAVLEVTSQGIVQSRHRFIPFHASVMTNVAPEHLEAHGGFESYLRAKLDLFWRMPRESVAVINWDDPSWQRFAAATAAHKVWYAKNGVVKNGDEWKVEEIVVDETGIAFACGGEHFRSRLVGEFNLYNILAAVALGLTEHVAPGHIAEAIARVSAVPGRMEFVQHESFAVIVDYAHTPDSLRSVYGFLKTHKKPRAPGGRFVCVLGAAGGGRDAWKRPEFGKIASEFCDEIILTNEDSYDEDPGAIVDAIAVGIGPSHEFRKILDRREAIYSALRDRAVGDIVVITGKGAEPWMMVEGGRKIPWDDRKVAREVLETSEPAPRRKQDGKHI